MYCFIFLSVLTTGGMFIGVASILLHRQPHNL